MNRITFLGELTANTGYGQYSAVLVKALQDAGFFVSIRPFTVQRGVPADLVKLFVHCPQPEEWEIISSPPHRDVTPGKRTIYSTMWESTRLPQKSVQILNRCEHIIVPTNWNKEGFEASGVVRPISVIPLGVDREVYPYRKPPLGPVIFGAAGNLHNGAKRKGIADAILAFQMAFPKSTKAQMWLKLTGNQLEVTDPRIKLFDKPMTEQELSQWYGRTSCFVSCARSEGWGLMQLQAMSTGRPVIGAAYAGMASYLDESVGYPVFYKEGPAEEIWTGLGDWSEPNLEHIALLMRHVYEHGGEVQKLGMQAATRAGSFSWQASNNQFIQLVNDLCRY